MFGILNVLDAPLPKAPAEPTVSVPAQLAFTDEDVTLDASTTDSDLARIDWILNPGSREIKIATDPASAYSQPWTVDVDPGNYLLVARAVRDGKKRDSAPVDLAIAHPVLESVLVFQNTLSWDAPANILGPDSYLRDKVRAQCWGAGGGGTTNTGAGGGGAFAQDEVDITPGNSYDAVVPAAAAANADGANATFGTTLVVAEGGKSGTNGSTGGLAANSTGTVKRDGGTGGIGTGTRAGGGGAGSLAAGSGSTGGSAEGGTGQGGTVGRAVGSGGGSLAGGQQASARGQVRLDYIVPSNFNFPRRLGYAVYRDSSGVNSRTPNMPADIAAGELLLCLIAANCAAAALDLTLDSAALADGWVQLTSGTVRDATSAIGASVYYKIADGADAAPTIESKVSGTPTNTRVSVTITRYADAGVPEIATATGNSTNANAPLLTPLAGPKNYCFCAFAAVDSATTNVSSVPGTYGGTKVVYPSTDVGAILISAHAYAATTSQDPAAFGTGSEQWVAGTISIPSSIVIEEDDEEPMVTRASSVGIFHSTDTGGPPGWVAMTAAAQAAHNATQLDAWDGDLQYAGTDLRMDRPGTYRFPPDRILISSGRTFSGAGAQTAVQIVDDGGGAGTRAIGPRSTSGQATFRDFVINGGGSAADGSDALVDYLVRSAGTLPATGAGGIFLSGVSGSRCKIAAIHVRLAAATVLGGAWTHFGELGLWSESCSECKMEGASFNGVNGVHYPEYGILLEGSGAGTATRNGVAMANGGLWRMKDIIIANVERGITWNGIDGGGIIVGTCEGSQVASFELTGKTTGVYAVGLRSNAGIAVLVNPASNNEVQCYCANGQHCEIKGVSYASVPKVTSASGINYTGVELRFGALGWRAYWHPTDCKLVSVDNDSPTDGYWDVGQRVWRRTPTSGQPEFWDCTAAGTPNGGSGVFTAGPNKP